MNKLKDFILTVFTFPNICLSLYKKEHEEKEIAWLFSLGYEDGAIKEAMSVRNESIQGGRKSENQKVTSFGSSGADYIETFFCDSGLALPSDLVESSQLECEKILPILYTALKNKSMDICGKKCKYPISEIHFISGYGPFAALRAGKAFAQGLAFGLGLPKERIGEWDIFSLYPLADQKKIAIHTGIPQWIIWDGTLIRELKNTYQEIASHTFSLPKTLNLSHIMACQGQK